VEKLGLGAIQVHGSHKRWTASIPSLTVYAQSSKACHEILADTPLVTSALTNIKIYDPSTLCEASGLLHDAAFGRDDVRCNASEGTFTLDAWRELRDQPSRERTSWIFDRITFPHRRCRLTFESVTDCSINVTDVLESYLVNDLVLSESRTEVRIETAYCTLIAIKMRELKGSLVDLDQVTSFDFNKSTLAFSFLRRP